MKTLHLILCVLATGTITQTQAQRGAQSRDVVIIPAPPDLFARSPNNVSGQPVTDGRTIIVGPSTSRFTSSAVVGRSTDVNAVPVENNAGGRMSPLIGPVFPARNIELPARGRAVGAGGVIVGAGGGAGTTDAGFIEEPLTDDLRQGFGREGAGELPADTVPGSAVPAPAVTAPLTPPQPIAPPQPIVPGSPQAGRIPGRTPNAVPSVPGSAVPAPTTSAPLAPPTRPALPPSAPRAPAPAPAGVRR